MSAPDGAQPLHTGDAARRPAERAARLIRIGALAIGVVLFLGTLYYINVRVTLDTIRRLGLALPLALLFSGLWHLARTWAWAWCFPDPRRVSFPRLMRVRLAAEAFSYLTLRGIAGEPLKVVLLGDRVDARDATAAVALERMAYIVGTTAIVGVGSLLALLGLPLTRTWFRVFRAFAIAAAVVMAFTAMVIAGRGTYVQQVIARLDRMTGMAWSGGRFARFVASVERQILELVRGNPRRLAVLVTATTAAYVCMALEAWVILRAAGVVASLNGALAAETFSRVASFGSAFIPANLGALEASSLAAAAAVGAAGGGTALALARRIRGLFWAGLGLAIYPRHFTPIAAARTTPPAADDSRRATLLYFPRDPRVAVSPSARLAGLALCERVLRPAARAGYDRILIWAPGIEREDPHTARILRRLSREIRGVSIIETSTEWTAAIRESRAHDVTAIGPGTVVSTALLDAALHLPAQRADVPAGAAWPASGVRRLSAVDAETPDAVLDAFAVRRDAAEPLPAGEDVAAGRATLALRIISEDDLPQAERTIRRASYKDTDNKLARFNRRTSLPISVALIRTPLTANQLSVMLVALGFYAAWLFSTGHYLAGVLGGFLSLSASVLDGCDGEIARLKYQESALGCWIETVGDYSYYVAIFIGLTIGTVRHTRWEGFYWVGAVALAGLFISFALLIYLRNRITAGHPEKLHTIAKARFKAEPTFWSRIIWRISFVATRSAMPYGIMAFALLNLLPGIVVLAAIGANIYWVSMVLKLRHLLDDRRQAQMVA